MGEARLIVAFLTTLPFHGEWTPGQQVVWEWVSQAAPAVGVPAAAVGDLDNDGWTDLVTFGCFPTCNALAVLSGRTGALLRAVQPVPSNWWFTPALVATGDLDGDGKGDYAVRRRPQVTPTIEVVEVRSGLDDHVMWSVQQPIGGGFGGTALGNLDLDGDGWPEVVLGAQGENQREGAVYVFDRFGQLLYRLSNNQGPFSYFGITLVSLGDLDGDGGDDFVVGHVDLQSRGTHEVYSGRTRQILSVATGAPGEALWAGADRAGDVDRDGKPDFVIGNGYGSVRVFSGQTGATIWAWTWPSALGFGTAVGGGVDLDRDGVPDVLVTAPFETWPSGPGVLYGFSGRDGSLLHRFSVPFLHNIPWAIETIPPQPGNPFGLFVVGQPNISRLALYSGAPAGTTVLGATCNGTLSMAPKIGLRHVGSTATRVHLSDADPSGLSVLMLGLSGTQFLGVPLPMSLAPIGFTGCSLHTSIDWAVIGSCTVSGGAAYCHVDLGQPTSATGGLLVHGQWLVLGTGAAWPGAVSDALSWRH